MCREKALAICLLNAVSSAANMRSSHTEASTHDLIQAASLCALRSPFGHCRRLAFALLHCETHASTFLSPFPRRGFASRTSRGSRRFGTMETLTPAPLTTPNAGLPAYCTTPSCRSVSNHAVRSDIALPTTAAYRTCSGLRLGIAGSPLHNAESSSFSYGPTIRLRLLPTPPHNDAVTFGYGAVAYSGTDFHRAVVASSRAHDTGFRRYDGKQAKRKNHRLFFVVSSLVAAHRH